MALNNNKSMSLSTDLIWCSTLSGPFLHHNAGPRLGIHLLSTHRTHLWGLHPRPCRLSSLRSVGHNSEKLDRWMATYLWNKTVSKVHTALSSGFRLFIALSLDFLLPCFNCCFPLNLKMKIWSSVFWSLAILGSACIYIHPIQGSVFMSTQVLSYRFWLK